VILNIVIRQLAFKPLRTTFTVFAIACVLSVVLVLEGFREGIYQQIRTIVLNRGADVIVSQSGISNLIASRSVLPQLSRQEIESIDGVVDAHPITTLPVIYTKNDRSMPVYIVVYDTLGAPAQLERGRHIENAKEIIIDESLAFEYGIHLQDDFSVSEFTFTVSGISKNTSAFFMPFAFIKYDDLIDLYFESDIVGDISTLPLLSFLLLKVKPEYSLEKIMQDVEYRVPAVDAWLPDKLAENDVDMSRSMLGPVFGLMISISYMVCVLVISLIMFSNTQIRKYELAVFKSMGFSFLRMALSVLIEVFVILLLALPFAFLIASFSAWLIEEMAPIYLLQVANPGPVIRTTISALLFSLIGCLLSFIYIARLEPIIAFRN